METSTFKIGIVVSRFNKEITQRLLDGALSRLRELHFADELITVAWVPGAIEIPVVAQRLLRQSFCDVVIALGAVIRGETDHYDYVCQSVTYGCQRVALENDAPVIFGVLTTENEEQALNRCGGSEGHKGKDAVDAAIEMLRG